jgi:DNA polymerase III, epsilon subunit and related 3''-5'' exonucleases
VQIAWQLHSKEGELVEQHECLVQPNGFDIPFDSERIHGISTALAQQEGLSLTKAIEAFEEALTKAQFVVGQNVDFDVKVVAAELYRLGRSTELLLDKPVLDTCTETTAALCQLPGGRGGRFKLPTLTELHHHLFSRPFEEAHNASADVSATARCFLN